MGQKVNPIGLRLGINRTWDSRWFSRKEYGNQLLDDLKLREFLGKRLGQAAVSKVLIERAARKTRITLRKKDDGTLLAVQDASVAEDGKPQKLELTYTPTAVGEYDVILEAEPVEKEANVRNNREV